MSQAGRRPDKSESLELWSRKVLAQTGFKQISPRQSSFLKRELWTVLAAGNHESARSRFMKAPLHLDVQRPYRAFDFLPPNSAHENGMPRSGCSD